MPLAGEWDVTLRPGRLPLSIPSAAPVAHARLLVRADTQFLSACTRGGTADCRQGDERITDAASGTFEIDAAAGFPRVHRRGEARLMLDDRGRLHLEIGPCCDAGAIYGSGPLEGIRGSGTWYQQLLAAGPTGRYRIERSP